jgi:hypothetical protein
MRDIVFDCIVSHHILLGEASDLLEVDALLWFCVFTANVNIVFISVISKQMNHNEPIATMADRHSNVELTGLGPFVQRYEC